ncbi:hypothetical protein [Puniceibacterium sediminis]|uniref:hypothetical protein n=1 Tax=Puniceibacterium sediminis TaxID=1608407 RepID=UPI001131E0DE|nr:hypothetical protein [Puniceibacterium sediminis]
MGLVGLIKGQGAGAAVRFAECQGVEEGESLAPAREAIPAATLSRARKSGKWKRFLRHPFVKLEQNPLTWLKQKLFSSILKSAGLVDPGSGRR